MPYLNRKCANARCGKLFRPRKEEGRVQLEYCGADCASDVAATHRQCDTPFCGNLFTVPKRRRDERKCAQCRAIADATSGRTLSPPFIQTVFDLETFGLDRGFGVVLVGSGLTFGAGKVEKWTFTSRDFKPWKDGRRSDDSMLGQAILNKLRESDILVAHNGRNFDVPFLNTVALKYGMPSLVGKKLYDPVQKARNVYRAGSNALGSLANLLDLDEQKMPVPFEIWRQALMDNDDSAWKTLVERCESDVRVLADLCARIAKDVNQIDSYGSAR